MDKVEAVARAIAETRFPNADAPAFKVRKGEKRPRVWQLFITDARAAIKAATQWDLSHD